MSFLPVLVLVFPFPFFYQFSLQHQQLNLKTQAPGYFRLALVNLVTALYDGHLKLEHTQLFKGITAPGASKKLLNKVFIAGTDVVTPISALLSKYGQQFECIS